MLYSHFLKNRTLPSIPLNSLYRFYVLVSYPAFIIWVIHLYYTQRWFPACPDFLRTLLWNVWLACPLYFLLSIVKKEKQAALARVYMLVAVLIYAPLTVLTLTHILLFRCHITFLSIVAVLQTDANEARNFLGTYVSTSITLIVLAFLISYFLIFIRLGRKQATGEQKRSSPKQAAVLALVALLVFVTMPVLAIEGNDRGLEKNNLVRANFVWRVLTEARAAMDEEHHKSKILSLANEPVDFGAVRLLDHASRRNYILILGEGASRHHMSLYGYPRQTSIQLDELRSELVVYDNVISIFGTTAPSLNASFIFHDLQKGQKGIASIVTLHQAAGFKTYWLNNNLAEKKGRGAAWFNISADVMINKNLATAFIQLSSYDEELLPDLKTILDDTTASNKFIVLHLAGVHPTYELRYPPGSAVFADFDTHDLYNLDYLSKRNMRAINHYDNAMIYNNKNIRAIIDMVHETPGSNYVLYLSDHSQQLYEVKGSFGGHVATGGTQYMYDIPFMVWLSPEYRRQNHPFAASLQSGTGRFWKMDDSLGHSVAELSRIGFGGFSPAKSLFSPQYQRPDSRLGDGTDYYSLPGPTRRQGQGNN